MIKSLHIYVKTETSDSTDTSIPASCNAIVSHLLSRHKSLRINGMMRMFVLREKESNEIYLSLTIPMKHIVRLKQGRVYQVVDGKVVDVMGDVNLVEHVQISATLTGNDITSEDLDMCSTVVSGYLADDYPELENPTGGDFESFVDKKGVTTLFLSAMFSGRIPDNLLDKEIVFAVEKEVVDGEVQYSVEQRF